jgi:hypothetical protein
VVDAKKMTASVTGVLKPLQKAAGMAAVGPGRL